MVFWVWGQVLIFAILGLPAYPWENSKHSPYFSLVFTLLFPDAKPRETASTAGHLGKGGFARMLAEKAQGRLISKPNNKLREKAQKCGNMLVFPKYGKCTCFLPDKLRGLAKPFARQSSYDGSATLPCH